MINNLVNNTFGYTNALPLINFLRFSSKSGRAFVPSQRRDARVSQASKVRFKVVLAF